MSKTRGGAVHNLSRIQSLVDELAERLGRSVELDTPSFEIVCASAQIGVIDDRRVTSIIHRAPPPEPVPWILSHGIQDALEPVRLPANEKFGMLPRVCFPVRRSGILYGYLWLFDQPHMSDEDIGRVIDYSDSLASLVAENEGGLSDRAEMLGLLAKKVLAGVEGSVGEAHDKGGLPDDGRLTVHIVRMAEATNGKCERQEDGPARRLQLELSRLHRSRPFLATTGPGVLMVAERSRSGTDTWNVFEEIQRAAIVKQAEIEAVGSACIDDASMARTGVLRARFMANVAGLPGLRLERLAWDEAGAWRLLFGRELSETTVNDVSDDAGRLLRAGDRGYWPTVLAYLDNARNAMLTSEQLFIHRSTLHYRLERAREITGDRALDDGWRAVALQVALRLYAAL